MQTGLELIAAERKRQVEELGYDVANDELYSENELAKAAFCYLVEDVSRLNHPLTGVPISWPWGDTYWKPLPNDRIRELIKAGALLKAQNERDGRNDWDEAIEAIATMINKIIAEENGVAYQSCESCLKEFDMDTMHADADSNYFCPECWEELAPIMQKEYEELLAKGEIEDPY